MSKAERQAFNASVNAFELKHGKVRGSMKPNGLAWSKLSAKLKQAAEAGRPIDLRGAEVQHLYAALVVSKRRAPTPVPERPTFAGPRRLSATKRRDMVRAARSGKTLREVADAFGVHHRTVAFWLERTAGQSLDAVDWRDREPGPAVSLNKVDADVERAVIAAREQLIEDRAPTFGPDAVLAVIRGELRQRTPSRRTVARILRRNGLLDRRAHVED